MKNNNPIIILSRKSEKFLERLFELEVPEIFDGLITIKNIVRVPGQRAKIAVFSDGLSFPKAIEITRYFKDRMITSFGIGTNLTNDITDRPLDIVIKMTRCQNSPVAKISDSPGKQMCKDDEYLEYLKRVFHG